MKKIITLVIIAFLMFAMLGCQNNDYKPYLDVSSYDIFDYYVLSEGDVVKIDEIGLTEAGYQYDDLVYQADHDDVVKVLYNGDIKAKNPGMTWVEATMYQDGNVLGNIAVGCFVVIDLNAENFVKIDSYAEFVLEIDANPDGNYYLGNNISFPNDGSYEAIDEFRGLLINPYGYVISNLTGDFGLFKSLDRAYVDGLVLDNFNLNGEHLGTITSYANESIILNTHVTNTELTCSGGNCGGLVGISALTVYDHVSFVGGTITGDEYVGGLVGIQNMDLYESQYHQTHFISNSYVYTDLTGTSDYAVGGLIGWVERDALVESSYFTGTIVGDNASQISNQLDNSSIYYIWVYTTLPVNYEDLATYGEYDLNYITEAELRTGTVLPGMENFTFEVGEIPKN